jgi:hypothetical protein
VTRLLALLALIGLYLRNAAGRDFQSRVMGDTASTGTGSYAAGNYMALSENGDAPLDGNTALVGELAAAGGGLVRAQAIYGHTAGASSYTLTKTYTMNANDGGTRTLRKGAIFNAAADGTMPFEFAIPNPPTLIPGDQSTVTETVNI